MLSLSPMKLFVIVAIVVVLLGPDKLPDVAHRMGKAWQSLRNLQHRVESELRQSVPDLPSSGDIARIVRRPMSVLNDLADRAERGEGPPTSWIPPAPSSTPPPEATSAPPDPSPPPSAPTSDPSLN